MPKLTNYMEILVEQMLDTTIRDMAVCKCERCKLDIMAIALNNLTPRYIVTDQGYLYTKLKMFQQQFSTDIIAAITRATMIVSENKRHD